MRDEIPNLADLLAARHSSAEDERRSWLEWVEAYVLYRLGALAEEEKTFVEGKMDLDAFFRIQSTEVRHALNVCIAAEGAGLDELLDHLAEAELS
jgi:hypothetical protein